MTDTEEDTDLIEGYGEWLGTPQIIAHDPPKR